MPRAYGTPKLFQTQSLKFFLSRPKPPISLPKQQSTQQLKPTGSTELVFLRNKGKLPSYTYSELDRTVILFNDQADRAAASQRST